VSAHRLLENRDDVSKKAGGYYPPAFLAFVSKGIPWMIRIAKSILCYYFTLNFFEVLRIADFSSYNNPI
jgi:hypothetical protein